MICICIEGFRRQEGVNLGGGGPAVSSDGICRIIEDNTFGSSVKSEQVMQKYDDAAVMSCHLIDHFPFAFAGCLVDFVLYYSAHEILKCLSGILSVLLKLIVCVLFPHFGRIGR